MTRKKISIPSPRLNLVVLSKKIEKLEKKIEDHRITIEIVTASHEQHMEHLSNFARHDFGNAVQSMFAVLKLSEKRMDPTAVSELKTAINNVNSSLENFEKLVPYTKDGSFDLRKLMTALELLCRASLSLDKIKCKYVYNRNLEVLMNQPFQALLQLLNNLMINSMKALKDSENEKIIEVSAIVDDQNCTIFVKDNGCGVPDENIDRIFEYKFTTTFGGSGIGLFHAKHVCKNIDGEISLTRDQDGFTTIFTLKFPLDGTKKDSDN